MISLFKKKTGLGLTQDEALRYQLVKTCGYSLPDVPDVYRFIKGDDNALPKRFWKNRRGNVTGNEREERI